MANKIVYASVDQFTTATDFHTLGVIITDQNLTDCINVDMRADIDVAPIKTLTDTEYMSAPNMCPVFVLWSVAHRHDDIDYLGYELLERVEKRLVDGNVHWCALCIGERESRWS